MIGVSVLYGDVALVLGFHLGVRVCTRRVPPGRAPGGLAFGDGGAFLKNRPPQPPKKLSLRKNQKQPPAAKQLVASPCVRG